jgi:ribosomal protein S15P/S13E
MVGILIYKLDYLQLMKQFSVVKIATFIALIVGGAGICTGSFLIRNAFGSNRETQVVSDTKRYEEIRNHLWANINQVKHFPQQIPVDAKNVQMVYSDGSAYGNKFLQIRLQQPQEKIQKLLSYYRKSAQHRYYGGDTNEHSNLPNGVPTTFFYTNGLADQTFPNSYEILVLGTDNQGAAGFKWQHGDSYGVAIASSSREIVYWVEKW